MGVPLELCMVVGMLVGAGCIVMPSRFILPVGIGLLTFAAVLLAGVGTWDVYLRVGLFLFGAVPGWLFRAAYDAVWLELDKHESPTANRAQQRLTPPRADTHRPVAWRALADGLINMGLDMAFSPATRRRIKTAHNEVANNDHEQRPAADQPPDADRAPADHHGHQPAAAQHEPQHPGMDRAHAAAADDQPAHRDPDVQAAEEALAAADPDQLVDELPDNIILPAEDEAQFAHDLLPDDAAAVDTAGPVGVDDAAGAADEDAPWRRMMQDDPGPPENPAEDWEFERFREDD